MKDVAVIYKTVYGSTEKYAAWIAGELQADLYKLEDIDIATLENYRHLVFGAPMFALRRFPRRRIVMLLRDDPEKHLFIFGVALGIIVFHGDARLAFLERLPDDVRPRVRFFTYSGAIDYHRLRPGHRLILHFLYRHLRRIVPSKRDEQTQKFFDSYGIAADFTDLKATASLIEACRQLIKKP